MRWGWAWFGLAAALVAVIGIVWWHAGEATAATSAAVIAAALAATGPLVSWLPERRAPTVGSGQEQLDFLTQRLAATVRQQWEKEVDIRQLRDPQPLNVRWTAADPALMDWPDVIHPPHSRSGRTVYRLSLAGSLDKIVEAYQALPRRRLVVTGQPGSGKTGFLLLLTLGLLAERQQDEPVPVLLTLTSWDPGKEPITQWLLRQMVNEYPFLQRSGAEALVDSCRVVPLLDGLDELPDDTSAAALNAINTAGVNLPLVIACRSAEFAQAIHAGDVLTGAAVVQLEPVKPAQVEDFLRRTTPPDRLSRWEPVFAQMRRGGSSPVVAALSTPLMVSLARTIYSLDRRSNPDALLQTTQFPTREAVEDHLLDHLITAAFTDSVLRSRRMKRHKWKPESARQWLGVLARHLQRRRSRNLAWWDLPPSGPLLWLVIGLWFGLGFATVFGIVGGLGVGFALVFGVAGTLVGALAGALRPAHLVLRYDRALRRSLALGLVFGLVSGLGFGIGVGIRAGPASGFVGALVGGLIGALTGLLTGEVVGRLMVALVRGSSRPPMPDGSLHTDQAAVAVSVVVTGLLSDLGIAAIVAALRSLGLAVLFDYKQVLAVGIVFGLMVAGLRPWPRYLIWHVGLAIRHQLPWRLMTFLEDAHRSGLLRQAGAVYQFRHARLQDRLTGD